jgi:hypothetical protein
MKNVLLLAACLAIAGCASLGSDFAQKPLTDKKKAQLNVYRVHKFAGSAASPYLCLDGKVIGELVNGSYTTVEIDPGEHVLMRKILGENGGDVKFTASAGESYFIRADYSNDTGAQETGKIAREAVLGYGARGAMGAAMAMPFYGSSKEKQILYDARDTRTKSIALNPGFLFVTSEFAIPEIGKTAEFKMPAYKNNPCAKPDPNQKPAEILKPGGV